MVIHNNKGPDWTLAIIIGVIMGSVATLVLVFGKTVLGVALDRKW